MASWAQHPPPGPSVWHFRLPPLGNPFCGLLQSYSLTVLPRSLDRLLSRSSLGPSFFSHKAPSSTFASFYSLSRKSFLENLFSHLLTFSCILMTPKIVLAFLSSTKPPGGCHDLKLSTSEMQLLTHLWSFPHGQHYCRNLSGSLGYSFTEMSDWVLSFASVPFPFHCYHPFQGFPSHTPTFPWWTAGAF